MGEIRTPWGEQELVATSLGISGVIKTSEAFGASPRNPPYPPQGHRDFSERQPVQEKPQPWFLD